VTRTDRELLQFRDRVRTLLTKAPVTLDLAKLENLDDFVESICELVLESISNLGGFCDYEFHVSGADFGGPWVMCAEGMCSVCGKHRDEHTLHPILLCADELELVKAQDVKAKR
jgi:hypothetical protein